MHSDGLLDIKSYVMVLYGSDGSELTTLQMPIAVVAPFGNRLFREVLGSMAVTEPWYSLRARVERQFRRTPVPVGHTSWSGQFYDAAADPIPPVSLHPHALVQSFDVCLFDLERELFRGSYSVDDIFLYGARSLLRQCQAKGQFPNVPGPYYYAVAPSKEAVHTVAPDVFPDSAYEAEGVFRLPPRTRDEPRIRFRPVPQPPPPERNPADFGPATPRGQGADQAGRVLMPARLFDDLRRGLTLSTTNEEGGYVLGNVYRQPGSPEKEDDLAFRWLLEVTDVLMAEDTVGSPVRLLFTGDTWSKINRRRDRDFAERKLVGWFHTHLFAASDTFGLSGMDQDMHAWYLPRPWQVAILLNLEADGGRTVRCYQRSTVNGGLGELVETPFEVFG